MRILVVSLLYPLPDNSARGTFVSDYVQALLGDDHDIRVVNPLPRMMKYQEARRSTLTGAARAPRTFEHGGVEVLAPRFLTLPDNPWPGLTGWSIRGKVKQVEQWLGEWRPEVIVCHTIWPVAVLASSLAQRWKVPWTAVVHGHDFDVGLDSTSTGPTIRELASSADRLVLVSERLHDLACSSGIDAAKLRVIPCHCAVEDEWLNHVKPWNGRWRKDNIEILFPADPRRPEKNHLLALQTGEILEQRGWIVGMTNLKIQPRPIVWDRMLVANITLVTSKRESGPLVARESIACGTPVVSVNVGDVSTYLPESCVVENYDPVELADACEQALQNRWTEGITLPPEFSQESFLESWTNLLEELVE
ncbi:MAG: hypothetical protein CMA63_04770 [Euryarchaeota archaeon]|nr:hypothetical protein [Euryarchaeota archaeon]